ncbi:putative C2H2 finger domain protein (Ezf) [Aspergillus homomorphus CBS 101889]|uniref:C2H2-type domain-containing protein n=1 Tax=Aspergillus homomorphus (strain CBS 101889) TaxID=1450537 RepID=A0A395I9T8_ASPHC|nr:hypothetical protein BO97DRAFT_81921 [Aspergillus homomorphus CBS 101889]RAL17030.1 hypothetical protein BO97DRAFT_81921 [Aspergillus homomorphus CBS 101889]
MNFTPVQYPAPSPFVSSTSDDHSMLDTTSAYASPMYAASFDMHSSRSLAGLGISHLGMETFPSEAESYPRSGLPILSDSNWSDTVMRPETFLQTPPRYNHLPSTTHYEPRSGVREAAASPSSFYSSHTFSTSPSHGSSTETEGQQDAVPEDRLFEWPSTPTSDGPNMPVDCTIMKGESEELWAPSRFEDTAPNTSSALSQMPPTPAGNPGSGIQWPQSASQGSSAGFIPDQETALGLIPADVISRWIEEVVGAPDGALKIPSASGLQCSVCGHRFTRRSNCREHEKRHDPMLRKSFPCDTCGKAYGRRTDLRRHVESTHLQLRKFYCEQCGQSYSRQDTLNRHKTDGCPRKTRKCNV